MNCKFCNAEMEENHKFCPFCGKSQEETQPEEVLFETAAVTQGTAPADAPVTEAPAQKNTKKNPWAMVFGITGAVLGLLALALALMLALGVDFKGMFTSDETEPTVATQPQEGDAAQALAIQNKDVVVATVGGKELTNAQLFIYYRMQVMDFLNYYGSYLEQLGIDITKPLSEQTCYYDETKSWEEFFLEQAVETWNQYQAVALLAEEAGFQLEGEWKKSLEQLKGQLEEQATSQEYESVDAMLMDVVGPTCTLEEYMKYVNLAYISGAYYESVQKGLAPTTDEVEAYFTENEAAYANQGVTKTSGNVAVVRHILLTPENGIYNEQTQETTYMEEDWENCLKEAEALLKEWKDGEATEESFAALVPEHTDDTGSAQTGGLYEDVGPGSNYVEPFMKWASDMTRQNGDTDIVQTQFGYHIMYYVSGVPHWSTVAKADLINKLMNDTTAAAEAKWPLEVDYTKVALLNLNLGA